jgi:Ca2+-dependent lipid-binding protein
MLIETLSFLWFSGWQEAVFFLGSLIFAAALLPSVLGKDKPAIQTSLTTGSVLLSFAIAYFTLALPFAAFITLVTVTLWYILSFQVWARNKKDSQEKEGEDI